MFVAAGSRNESEGEHGLSHLLEHMAFKGTAKRNARAIAETIENVGGDLNAETGVEQTAYFARVLGEDVDLALDVIADILTDSQFDPEELAREKNVILQEIGSVEDAPDDFVFDLFTAAAWPGQPIGRPILGTRESVGGFDRAAIAAYLRRHYRAGAAIVAAAGAVDHDRIVARAESLLAPLGADKAEPPAPAAYRGGESIVKKRLEQTHIVVGFEGRAIAAPDHDAAHVFAAAAGGGMSSRLFQEVREKRGLAYSIYSFHWGFSDCGLFGFYAGSAAQGRRRGRARRARLPRRGRRADRRNGSGSRQGAVQGLDLDRARIALGARAAARAPDLRLWRAAVARRHAGAHRGDQRRRRSPSGRGHA